MNANGLPLGGTPYFVAGRILLAMYFFVPGVMKIVGFEGTAAYMAQHGVVLVPALLVATIIYEVGGGILLAIGYRTAWVALLLAALVLVINVVMHDFWNEYEGLDTGHEMQNFIKNLGIMAGLLVLAGSAGPARTT